ncbi:MAG: hypothetical protein IVW57_13110, partial [Ktedonobacterales bacterium]|nr:hypothetical protein [Ktedonobacterales bacterium]
MAPPVTVSKKSSTGQRRRTSATRNASRAFARVRALTVGQAALALLTLAALYRLTLVLRGWPTLDSDEAIIGLMARHILSQHELPIFFWGQEYMGALEAYLAAGVFALLGPSVVTLHLMTLALTLGFLAAIYALGRAAYGPAAGLLALAWLAFGPSFALLRGLAAIGGYQEMLLFSALVLLGVWARLRHAERLPADRAAWRRSLATYAGIGLAAGLGLWSDLLIAPILLVAFVVLVWARPRELLTRAGVVLALAFALGALPFLAYNVIHPNATYIQVSRQTRAVGAPGPLPAPGDWARQIVSVASVGLPAVLGSPHLCVASGGIWLSYPRPLAETTQPPNVGCDAANTALSGAFLAVLTAIAWQLASAAWAWGGAFWRRAGQVEHKGTGASESRGETKWEDARRLMRSIAARWWASATETRSPEEARASARCWLRAMLLGAVVATLAVSTLSIDAQRYQFTSARYLLPVYLAAPLVAGALWRAGAPWLRSVWHAVAWRLGRGAPDKTRGDGRDRRGIAAAGLLALLLALSVTSGALTLARASDGATFGVPLPLADRQLVAALDAHNIRTFYSDYWTCYRIAFETNERLLCAVRGQDGADERCSACDSDRLK